MTIYLIGSLRNPSIPSIGQYLRQAGYDVFDDWHAAGPDADMEWKRYEQARGHTYREALDGFAAEHVFSFDLYHLNRADMGILVLPAGRSAFTEFGYLRGQGKPVYILLDDPDRWDVMVKFATGVVLTIEELLASLTNLQHTGGKVCCAETSAYGPLYPIADESCPY